MKKNYYLLMLLASFILFGCGGSDDDPEPTPTPTPTVTPPTVVSTIPANQAAGIAVGNVQVTVTYDKDVNKSSDTSLQPTVSGGTLSQTAAVNGKELTFSVNNLCNSHQGIVNDNCKLIGPGPVLAADYEVSNL